MHPTDANDALARSTTRRTVVTTGAKLAYVAPLVAASFKLTTLEASAENVYDVHDHNEYFGGWTSEEAAAIEAAGGEASAAAAEKVTICHATCSDTNPFVLIEIAVPALKAHEESHHKGGCLRQDIIPAPTDGNGVPFCPAAVPSP